MVGINFLHMLILKLVNAYSHSSDREGVSWELLVLDPHYQDIVNAHKVSRRIKQSA